MPDDWTSDGPLEDIPSCGVSAVLEVAGMGGDLGSLCAEWLQADEVLENLTLDWSRSEVAMRSLDVDVLPAAKRRLRALSARISRLDRRKSQLISRIRLQLARDSEEALGKLLVAKRLMEGEGGVAHDLVADALSGLRKVVAGQSDQGHRFSRTD